MDKKKSEKDNINQMRNNNHCLYSVLYCTDYLEENQIIWIIRSMCESEIDHSLRS